MKKLKILFVAMSDSIHTARWISQVSNLGWDVHLFPSVDRGITHPDFENLTIYHSFYSQKSHKTAKIAYKGINVFKKDVSGIGRRILREKMPGYRQYQLKEVIKKLKPDIIHSLEFQSAGYLVLDVKEKFHSKFPKWIATNWGSDIYLFSQLANHKKKVIRILETCDYYSCECKRDVLLAKQYGLKGKLLPVIPNSGALTPPLFSNKKEKDITKRKYIIVKGYQGIFGRALVALCALEKCKSQLKGYTIIIYSTIDETDVAIAAELFSSRTGIPTKIIPYGTSHKEILALQQKSRIYIGLSISDGISTSLLEAMSTGTFPIQSCTSCANEWIQNGKTGFIVPPEDPDIIAKAIRKALTDDVLVRTASKKNMTIIKSRLNQKIIDKKIKEFYSIVLSSK